MKIHILTFHTPINYGAILQAYALQKYLRMQFPEIEIKNIDFKTPEHVKKYNIFLPLRKNVLEYFYNQFFILLKFNEFKERKRKFKYFLDEEFSLTQRFYSVEDLLNNVPDSDYYVVGSDQVFHPNSPYLRAYYLNFEKGKSKKIAYAPSFGMSNFTDSVTNQTKPYLLDFDHLSCRENDGSQFLSKIMGRNVPMVVDPIFLLSKDEWGNMAVNPEETDKFIFVYDLNGGENLIKIANEIKKLTGYSIICQTQTAHKSYRVDKQLYNLGPREFVGHILNAEFIVTDSFHGTAFSILFQKRQFVYIARPKASSRIESLMALINGKNRVFSTTQNLVFQNDDIHFEYHMENLQEVIHISKKYLKNSITTQNDISSNPSI